MPSISKAGQFAAGAVLLGAISCLLSLDAKAANAKLANADNKTCDRRIFDACTATLMVFGRRDVKLPKDFSEMGPHCQEEFEAEECIKQFSRKCLAHFERQVAHMLVMGAGQVLRKRCGEEGTKEYLTHFRCIKSNLDKLHDAMDQLIYTMMAISDLKDSDAKIPQSCCSFARFQDIANRIIRQNCQDFDKTAEDYIGIKMIRGYVGDILDLSCNGYETSGPKCLKLKLPSGGYEWKNMSLARLPKVALPPNKPNSVMLPFLKIFTNL